jgi:hypothetical protein
VYVEVCSLDGKALPNFSYSDCQPISTDSTKHLVTWKGGNSLELYIGKPIRFKFYLTNAKLYAFWVSQNIQGVSGGATAAGGPGLNGYWDV